MHRRSITPFYNLHLNLIPYFLQNWKTVLKCKEIALQDIQYRFNRNLTRVICISDTGGENNGSTALSCYSFSESDLGMQSVWAPTAAHHSGFVLPSYESGEIDLITLGQLSDSSCGTLKRLIKGDLKSGKGKNVSSEAKIYPFFVVLFLNSAAKVVDYCKSLPVTREVSHVRFLRSKTMLRSYHHITRELVDHAHEKLTLREVKLLAGNLNNDLFYFNPHHFEQIHVR